MAGLEALDQLELAEAVGGGAQQVEHLVGEVLGGVEVVIHRASLAGCAARGMRRGPQVVARALEGLGRRVLCA
ncbi:hypothetical protein PtoMrB4_41120 [Metapseudomonas otitidis]|uniref:Uncharacterized protein n=1 Tax=Metapseudomonas otitidis TaxID=319939 RepID=A0A679GK89_9GAMM|nr:hypothetical protein PtoMrB4_41120 [Pseudomonas otitidis]